ncbi:hypothetical protein MIT9_P2342 [Methylomarinovum caldicuralii]|uniref:Uncharacterized protein n=1 Tax=Methylomarinovum caldicuralii TaxID=438856 RepID=A0AAU9CM37_9GAMM|nr:hypothetical protein [Methylomarinovum caldicuralii]BCX82756.1 hypothetical protein MIT9_P2342 [Methylomarinovum caldicuralii]
MKRLALLWLLSLPAWAEDDLLKVGKTPAEKLDEKTAKAKDNVDKALATLKRKKAATTAALFALGGPQPAAPLPDPTAPDETFQQTFRTLLRGQSQGGDGTLPPMPDIKLAALVRKPQIPPAVLLKIDGQVVMAESGEEISLIREGRAIQVRVQEIGEDSVRLLVIPHNELLTLH